MGEINEIVHDTVNETLEAAANLVDSLARIEQGRYGCQPYARDRLHEAAEAIRRLKH